jgi:hypothetical protein
LHAPACLYLIDAKKSITKQTKEFSLKKKESALQFIIVIIIIVVIIKDTAI